MKLQRLAFTGSAKLTQLVELSVAISFAELSLIFRNPIYQTNQFIRQFKEGNTNKLFIQTTKTCFKSLLENSEIYVLLNNGVDAFKFAFFRAPKIRF